MRILAIRGGNVASLAGEFSIELDRGPLGSAGLFAIVGPTGAGKSTLLDALCAALYNRTPRLDGRTSVKIGREDEPEELHLSPFDPRSLLRRGAAAGYAEVDFEGQGGKKWRARWSVRRARGRADGRLQEVEQTLVCLDTGAHHGGTRTETLAAIEAALGLSFDQFRRSALLAQGEFAAFLRADAAQRASLLERVTGTEIYGQISIAAHQKAAEVEVGVAHLRDELARIATLDDDARAAAIVRRDQAAALAAEALAEEQRLAKAHAWELEAASWRARIAEAVALAEAAAVAAAGVPVARAHLARIEVAETARPAWNERARAAAAAEAATAAVTEAVAVAVTAAEAEAAAVAASSAAIASLAEARATLEAARPALAQARALDERLAEASRVAADAKALATRAAAEAAPLAVERRGLLDEEQRLREALAGEAARLDAALARVADAKAQHLDAQHRWQLAEDSAREKPLAPAEAKLDALRAEQLALKELQQAQAEAARLVDAEREASARVEVGRATAKRRRADAKRLDTERVATRAQLVEAEHAGDRLRAAAGLGAHRAELRDGEPCAVCGATEHPWAGQGAVDAMLAEQDARVAALRTADAALAEQLAAARAEADAAKADATRAEAEAAKAREDQLGARARWRTGVVAIGELLLADDPSTGGEWLAARTRGTEEALARVQREHKAARKLADELRRLDGVMRARQSDLEQAEEARRDADERHQRAQAQLAGLGLRLADLRGRAEAAEAAAARCAEASIAAASRRDAVGVERAGLLAGLATDAAEAMLVAAVTEAEARASTAGTRAAATRADRAAADARVEHARLATTGAETALAGAHAALAEVLARAAVSEAELAALLVHAPGIAAERARLDGLDRAVAAAATIVDERRARAAEHALSRPPGSLSDSPTLGSALELARERREAADLEARAAVSILDADDRARVEHGARVEALAQRDADAAVHRELAELIGSHDGRKLRTFAQSLSLDALLAAANAHLDDLQPRYCLERVRGHDLELQVVDRDMGDEVRSVHSLSGGESFLVSLALALGLSSLSAKNVRVRTLLIDEGFGTLDPATLDVALDALDALQSAGRQVGIISHVPGLAERVAAQVHVRPLGGGRSDVATRAAS